MIFLIERKGARYITRGDMVIITDLNKIGNFSNMTPMNLQILSLIINCQCKVIVISL